MRTITPKKKGRFAGRPQRNAPVKVQIATGEGIHLSARHKKILTRVRRFLSDALDASDEIENNIARGQLHFFAENTTALRRTLCGCRHLCRGVAAVNLHARQEDVR